MNLRAVGCTMFVLFLGVRPVSALLAETQQLDSDARAEVIGTLAERIEQQYYDAGKAAELAAGLRTKLQAGRFDEVTNSADLAAALSADLVAADRHFNVVWTASGAEVSGEAEQSPDWSAWARRHNYGFRTVEVLPGNVGYLDLRVFDDPATGGDTAHAAMRLLAGTDALIVDLRHNGGGEPGMVALLCSYFFAERVHLNSLYWREGDATHQYWTLAHLPGPRLSEIPVYILIARRTGSAAEEFAYNLKTRERATLIGRRTAGAANPGERFALPHGFAVFISTGTAINPVTGQNWEGTGVGPDIDVPSDQAFELAVHRALGHLLEGAADDPVRKREIEWALEALTARKEPVALTRDTVRALVGSYGDREVRRRDGRLTYQRGERPEREMIPLGQERFLIDGIEDMRVHFERDERGRVLRLVETWAIGHQRSNPRD